MQVATVIEMMEVGDEVRERRRLRSDGVTGLAVAAPAGNLLRWWSERVGL